MTDLEVNTTLPLRRNRQGIKASEWCHWPEETAENMDSLYHIQQVSFAVATILHRSNFHLSIFNNLFDATRQTLISFSARPINRTKAFGSTST